MKLCEVKGADGEHYVLYTLQLALGHARHDKDKETVKYIADYMLKRMNARGIRCECYRGALEELAK